MNIYDISGRRFLPLTARHVQALTDGGVWLMELPRLRHDLDLEPYCLGCQRLGQIATVAVTLQDRHADIRCRHRAGRIRRTGPLVLEPLLQTLNWCLRCTACGQAVRADNGAADATLVVSCPCTVRRMANPLPAASRLSPVERVGRTES